METQTESATLTSMGTVQGLGRCLSFRDCVRVQQPHAPGHGLRGPRLVSTVWVGTVTLALGGLLGEQGPLAAFPLSSVREDLVQGHGDLSALGGRWAARPGVSQTAAGKAGGLALSPG